MAALETALELATSLHIDTAPAEEHAASARGLLSIRVVGGSLTRFLLMPLGVSFRALMGEISRRFSLHAGSLWSQEGGEAHHLCDQFAWDACLRRRGLLSRPGRLELHFETSAALRRVRQPQTPFVVTGTRLAPGPSKAVASPRPPKAPISARQRPPLPMSRPASGTIARQVTGPSPRPKVPRRQTGILSGAAVAAFPAASPPRIPTSVSCGVAGWGIRRSSSKGPSGQLQLEGKGTHQFGVLRSPGRPGLRAAFASGA